MWLVVSLVVALAASVLYLKLPATRKKYKLGVLALMFWGMTIMVAVDHTMAFLNGDPFIEFTTDGLIGDSVLLGFAMVLPILLVWAVLVYASLGKRISTC